jgi:hypothetical protein
VTAEEAKSAGLEVVQGRIASGFLYRANKLHGRVIAVAASQKCVEAREPARKGRRCGAKARATFEVGRWVASVPPVSRAEVWGVVAGE